MLKYIFYLSLMTFQLHAACEKCEIIREANKKLPPPKHEYYDDYLKELKEEEEEKIDFLQNEKKE